MIKKLFITVSEYAWYFGMVVKMRVAHIDTFFMHVYLSLQFVNARMIVMVMQLAAGLSK